MEGYIPKGIWTALNGLGVRFVFLRGHKVVCIKKGERRVDLRGIGW